MCTMWAIGLLVAALLLNISDVQATSAQPAQPASPPQGKPQTPRAPGPVNPDDTGGAARKPDVPPSASPAGTEPRDGFKSGGTHQEAPPIGRPKGKGGEGGTK